MSGASVSVSGRQSLATIIIIIFPGQNLRELASPQRTNKGAEAIFGGSVNDFITSIC